MYCNKSEYYDLPTKYNENVVRLLMQSPRCIFAYWDISDEISKSLFSPILKIVNVSKGYYYEIPVDYYANNYYIHVEDLNCIYRVELRSNSSAKVLFSNLLNVPNDAPINDFYDEALFRNYLCLADTKKIKVYTPKRFCKQNHTDFESFGSSDIFQCAKKGG